MCIPNDLRRKYDLIYHLYKAEKPTLRDLEALTGIPQSTIKRQLKTLKSEYGVKVLFIRDVHARGMSGYYVMSSWGVFDRRELLQFYATM